VPPARYVDLAILRGDPSDGLPGVPGVGEKTAARLAADHPDLDALLAAAAAGRLPPRVAAALQQHAGYLQAMRRVVPVASDVAYQVSDPHPPDEARLAALAQGHNLDGPVKRLLAALEQTGLAG
jgi:5'-3' exonuclease